MDVLHIFETDIRGGGVVGGKSWVARILGVGGPYKYERKFVSRDDSQVSGSGRSGKRRWFITAPGVYELRGFDTGESIATQSLAQAQSQSQSQFYYVDAAGHAEVIAEAEVAARLDAAEQESK